MQELHTFNKKYVLWNVYLPNVVRCIPYTVIEIFDYNCNDLELGRFKVIQGSRAWCQSITHGSYSTSIDHIVVFVTVFEIIDCNFNDFELEGFTVIQGQR